MFWLLPDVAGKALSVAPSGDIKEMALAFSAFVLGALGILLRIIIVMDRNNKAQAKLFSESLERQNKVTAEQAKLFSEALERQNQAQERQNQAHIKKTEVILGMIESATRFRDEKIETEAARGRKVLEKTTEALARAAAVLELFEPPKGSNGKES